MFREKAIEKLNSELKVFKSTDQKANAVKSAVAETLKEFCKQDEEFAQAIVQNDKTLSDCCTEIMNKVGNSISDLEVYKKAVKFYFSTADISVSMAINLCGNIDTPDKPSNIINLSFDDLFND